MQVINMTKRQFESLEPLELSKKIFCTEAQMYLFNHKEKWIKHQSLLKRLYQDSGEVFSNKLYTVNELIDKKEQIGIEELVMPEALAAVDNNIIGFTMPYIPNINLAEVLDSRDFTIDQKVAFLKEIGELLEKVRKARKYKGVEGFYLNDIHINNFILNNETGRINAVDLDSSKIGNNLAAPARYLTPLSKIADVPKYKKSPTSLGGEYEINNDTEIYCYIAIIFQYFFGDNIGTLTIPEYFVYLDYLSKIGVSKELLDILSYIYTGHDNKNPYEYLEMFKEFYGRTHKNTFDMVRKRAKF